MLNILTFVHKTNSLYCSYKNTFPGGIFSICILQKLWKIYLWNYRVTDETLERQTEGVQYNKYRTLRRIQYKQKECSSTSIHLTTYKIYTWSLVRASHAYYSIVGNAGARVRHVRWPKPANHNQPPLYSDDYRHYFW